LLRIEFLSRIYYLLKFVDERDVIEIENEIKDQLKAPEDFTDQSTAVEKDQGFPPKDI